MDFEQQLIRTRKIVLLILVLFSAGLILDPRSPVVWGLVFGTAVSLINALQLGNRLNKMAHLPVHQAVTFMKIGYGMRLVLIIASLMLAFKHPEFLNLKATAAGLFVAPAVSVLVFGFFLFFRDSK